MGVGVTAWKGLVANRPPHGAIGAECTPAVGMATEICPIPSGSAKVIVVATGGGGEQVVPPVASSISGHTSSTSA